MNRHAAVVVASSAVIAALLGHSAYNVTALDSVQMGWNSRSSFDMSSILNGGAVLLCNPSFTVVSFSSIEVSVMYAGAEMGRLTINGGLLPVGAVEVPGRGGVVGHEGSIASLFLSESLANPDMSVQTRTNTHLVGIIPYTITDNYAADDFARMMSNFECAA